MHQTLSIPQHRDPVARAALITLALALVWLAISSALPAASAQEQPQPQPTVIVLVATPTLPASVPEAAPMVSAPTAEIPAWRPASPTQAPVVVVEAPPAAAIVAEPAPTEPHVGERGSDKAGPGDRKAPPVVRH